MSDSTEGPRKADGHINGHANISARPSVLLVEDEIFIRIASADWLRDAGMDVVEAADAHAGLAILESDQVIDLLATDITMPGELNGLDLARKARALRPDLPVLLISAHLPDNAGIYSDGVLPKPYGPSDLVGTVKELVEPIWQSRISNRKPR